MKPFSWNAQSRSFVIIIKVPENEFLLSQVVFGSSSLGLLVIRLLVQEMGLVFQRIVFFLAFVTSALYISGSLEKRAIGSNDPYGRREQRSVQDPVSAYHYFQGFDHDSRTRMLASDTSGRYSSLNAPVPFVSAQSALSLQLPGNGLFSPAVSGNGLFSDEQGWGLPKYYSTVQTVSDGSTYYFAGRGACGMYIYKYNEGKLSTVNECGIKFADSNGWGDVDHYSTIKATVVNGSLYISGRGHCGMHIYKIVDNMPKVISMCEIKFTDRNGWSRPEYYSTIQTTKANGNLYIFGRGSCGIEMYQTWEDKIYLVTECMIPFRDDLGWNSKKYYSTITSTLFREHIYVIGRSPCGLIIYKTLTGKLVKLISACEIEWSDHEGWDVEDSYSTIRTVADDKSMWISGRSKDGMVIWRLVDDKLSLVAKNGINWSQYARWYYPNRYSTIGAAVVDHALYVYGRDDCGMMVFIVAEDGIPMLASSCQPEWGNLKGWGNERYYKTIQGTAGHGLVLSARSACGLVAFEVSLLSSTPIVSC